jgi:putative peptidoglycan lipid II flippase
MSSTDETIHDPLAVSRLAQPNTEMIADSANDSLNVSVCPDSITTRVRGIRSIVASCRNVFRLSSQPSVNRRIVAAMITVVAASGAVKLVTIVKEIAIAARFGTGDQIDAFVIAFALPSFFIGVTASAFNAAVIPTYVQVRDRQSRALALDMISSVTVCTCALLVAVTVVLALAAPTLLSLLGSGFSPEKLWMTRTLFFLLLPYIVLSGCTAIWAAALTAEERFALVSVAPVGTPIIIVIALWTVRPSAGIYALPLAMIAGAIVESYVLARGLRKQGFPLIPRWRGLHPATRGVTSQFVTAAFGAFMMSSTVVVDHSMAATLGDGSVATLNYGTRLPLFLLGFFSGAMSTAVLPQFSALVARSDWSELEHSVRTLIRWILIVSIPVTALLIALSVPITRLLFERGAFGPDATLLVGRVQALYLLQVPFYLVAILLVRLVSSFKANHLLMWGSGLNVIVNIVLNYILMRLMGVSGIALSTSLVLVVSCCFLAVTLTRVVRQARGREVAA